MKRINRVENFLLILVSIGALFYGLFNEMPELLLKTYEGRYNAANIEFDPFWNFSFPNLYKTTFVLLTFLFTKIYTHKTWLNSQARIRNTVSYISAIICLVIPFILLEIQYNHSIEIALSSKFGLPDLNLFFGLLHLPLDAQSASSLTFIKSMQFITVCFLFISMYFLAKHFLRLPEDRKVISLFLRSNQKDITYIFTGLMTFGLIILLFNLFNLPILSFSVYIQVLSILLSLAVGLMFNVFWYYPKTTSKGYGIKTLYSLSLHLYLGATSTAVLFITSGINSPFLGLRPSLQYFMISLSAALFLLLMGNLLSLPYYLIRRKAIARHAELVKKIQVQSSELSFLKSQINPHFLFNSLNTVYGLALEEQSPKTAEGVQKLSEMMRFMLQENKTDKIPLEREIKYIHDYIDFQRLRISEKENISLDINIPEGCEGQIAPMLLIPMIENAFKHGISMQEPSWIKVNLTYHKNEVQLTVKNSMHPKDNHKADESGIGLGNVSKRLGIIYPQKHLFKLFENESSFEANVKVILS